MKALKKVISLIIIISFIFPLQTLGAGSTSIGISNSAPKVGDTFTVNISATESGPMTIGFKSSVLSLESANVSGDTTSHSISFTGKSATLTFKAISAGSSGIVVESDVLSGSSISVNVSGGTNASDTTENTETNTQTEPTDTGETTTVTGNSENGDFNVDGIDYVVSERFSKDEIPRGFTEVRINVNGKDVKELTNGVITLVYLKPASDTKGKGEFYILDEQSGAVSKFMMLGSMENYVILTTPDSLFSDVLIDAILDIEGVQFNAYQVANSDSEFYYVYGINNEGVEGWYAYDSFTGNVSRADTMNLSLIGVKEDEPDTEAQPIEEKKSFKITPNILLYLGIFFFVLLVLVIIINMILSRRNKDEYDEDDYDDTDDTPIEDSSEDNDRITFEPPSNKVETIEETHIENINEENIEPVNNDKSLYDGINSDELIDNLIKKAQNQENSDIIDLDDL